MVLIMKCDDAGRVVEPVSFEEKCRLWKASMNLDGSVDWVVLEEGYHKHSLIGELSSDSESDDDSTDIECILL